MKKFTYYNVEHISYIISYIFALYYFKYYNFITLKPQLVTLLNKPAKIIYIFEL